MKHLSIQSENDFNKLSLEIFRLQAENNPLYKDFLRLMHCKVEEIKHWKHIPCLPVSFFKSHSVKTGNWKEELIFKSSGTTGSNTSHHFVKEAARYTDTFLKNFQHFYGDAQDWCFVALLPSYVAQGNSSLVYMAEGLIQTSKYEESGFYAEDYTLLREVLTKLKADKVPVILLGVTYALLDFAEQFPMDFPELIVMETGGMKGRRKEMVREELHAILCNGFGVGKIHSEYGMTELLSQAYSKGDGIYQTPPWMKIHLRDTNDPLSEASPGQTGGINIIDLANADTSAFIAVQDLGKVGEEGSFQVLGRFDNSDLRGCSLLLL